MTPTPTSTKEIRIVLGIDPGSLSTGYGLIKVLQNKLQFLACGNIRTGGGNFPLRLKTIFTELKKITELYQPDEMAIEQVFISRNPDSALKLGQARGAAICAVQTANISVIEYTANQVKQAIVGKGHAGKKQVQHMVKVLLNLEEAPQSDAADALAIAICHANTQNTLQNLNANVSQRYPKEVLQSINGRRKKRFKI